MNLPCGADVKIVSGCSKRPDFSPAQPWRAEMRLVPGKAAASYPNMILLSLLVYIVPGMARMSPPLRTTFSPATHWHAETCHTPRRGSSDFIHFALKGSRQTVLYCAHRTSTVSSCAFCEHKGWSGCSLRPSEASRCASTGDSPGYPSPAGGFFQQPAMEKGIRPRY